jgi:hypothetical protein
VPCGFICLRLGTGTYIILGRAKKRNVPWLAMTDCTLRRLKVVCIFTFHILFLTPSYMLLKQSFLRIYFVGFRKAVSGVNQVQGWCSPRQEHYRLWGKERRRINSWSVPVLYPIFNCSKKASLSLLKKQVFLHSVEVLEADSNEFWFRTFSFFPLVFLFSV